MDIKGSRITIKPLTLEDVYKMKLWGFHDNPLLADYNFPNMQDKEIIKWYKYKTNSWRNKYYGISNEDDKFIGYLGIKDIKKFKKESTLGIVFDPSFISMGYGTDTLITFLRHYFTTLDMKRMYLEVAEFNKRAHKLYENMGFKQEGYYLDVFFDQKVNMKNTYYINEESSFVISDKKIYNYIYRMRLEKEDFFLVTKNRS